MLKAAFIAVAVCTSIACIGQTASPVQDPHAMSILSLCAAAMGTPNDTFTLMLTGSIVDTDHADAVPRPLVVKDRGRTHERWEETYPTGRYFRIVAGTKGVQSRMGHKTPLSMSQTVFRVPEFMPGYACQMAGQRKNLDVQYVGSEALDGITVDHIRVGKLAASPKTFDETTLAALLSLDIFVDANTHLVRAIRQNSFQADNYDSYLPIEFRYSSFQVVSGVQIAVAVKHIFNQQLIESVDISSASPGGSVNSEDFK